MVTLRTLALATAAALALSACAQNPGGLRAADHAAHAPAGAHAERMATMDRHMQAMHAMHEKMARAGTPQERQALMAEHMRLMHEGMAMMGGMGMGMGMRGMAPAGAASAPMDMATRQQLMEKRMEMMHSMVQMMMDRMGPPPAQP